MAVFVVDADGTHRKRLTSGTGHSDPAWSPDGRSILYLAWKGGRLFLMDADGGHKRVVPGTHLAPPGGTATRPPAAWSPDGRQIFYIDEQGTLFVVHRDGSRPHRITPADMAFSQFALSPDGTRIALAAKDGYHRDIYLVHSDGSGFTRLTSGGIDSAPSWSPDGRRIVSEAKSGVDVMNADRSDRAHIADGGAPAWAPT
jgi:Tol biopolymer transport system component